HVSRAIRFTENKGQWDEKVLFRADLPGGAMFLEKNCVTYSFYDSQKLGQLHLGGLAKDELKGFSIRGHAYKVHFENCGTDARPEKFQQGTDYENFYIGNNPARWKTNVRNYSQAWLRGLYEGIDYELLAAAGGAKYNLHVSPGADPVQIAMRFEGVEDISL